MLDRELYYLVLNKDVPVAHACTDIAMHGHTQKTS